MAFYAMSNKEGEIPRKKIEDFSIPISNILEISINYYPNYIETVDEIKKVFRKSQQKKINYGINFLNVGKTKDTIEFRLSNGTIDADTWIQNINLFGGLIKVSEELAKIKLKPEIYRTKEDAKKLELLSIIKNMGVPYEERLEAFLSLTIPEEKKEIYRNRYIVNMDLIKKDKQLNEFLTTHITNRQVDFNIKKDVISRDYND